LSAAGGQAAPPSRVGVLGTGAMGSAMAAGLGRIDPAPALLLSDAVPASAEAAAAATGGSVVDVGGLSAADLLVVAVKPADAPGAVAEAAAVLAPGAPVLSVVAGLSLERLSELAPGRPVLRAMPNLAVRHGAGLVVLASSDGDAGAAAALAEWLAPLGTVVPLAESLFPAATALAGSGPGLLALVAEALEEGGVACGLTRPASRAMTAAVVAGTGALLADGTDPSELRRRVTSPGGTTAAGIAALERGAVRAHVADAVRAAAARAREL
jgi:pyrroline-5-carboxylate reductase